MSRLALPRSGIVSLSVVKNEADIIEPMVRQNLKFIDKMFFVDNGSVDGTFQILQALSTETGRVEVSTDARIGHLQKEIINQKIREIGAEAMPHQLVLLDGDEIILSSPERFRSVLANCNTPLLFPWRTFVPWPSDDLAEQNPLRRIVHYRESETPQYYKTTVPGRYLQTAEVRPGSHSVAIKDMDGQPETSSEIFVGHWPVRSKDQIIAKTLVGSWNMKQRKRGRNEGFQWHDIAERYLTNGQIPDSEYFELGPRYSASETAGVVLGDYAQYFQEENKYAHFIMRDPLFLVAKFVEEVLVTVEC